MAFGAGYKVSAVLEKDKERRANKKRKHEGDKKSPHLNLDASPLLTVPPSNPPASGDFPSSTNVSVQSGAIPATAPHPGGWSDVLEDWLVRGVQHIGNMDDLAITDELSSSSPESLQSPVSLPPPEEYTAPPPIHRALSESVVPPTSHSIHSLVTAIDSPFSRPAILHQHSMSRPTPWLKHSEITGRNSPPVANRSMSPSDSISSHRGPYELAVKERMMGVYLAVYVHRACLPLVRGSDKHAVAAGLIGGRVGNKGGGTCFSYGAVRCVLFV